MRALRGVQARIKVGNLVIQMEHGMQRFVIYVHQKQRRLVDVLVGLCVWRGLVCLSVRTVSVRTVSVRTLPACLSVCLPACLSGPSLSGHCLSAYLSVCLSACLLGILLGVFLNILQISRILA